jgi:hypothetical protein
MKKILGLVLAFAAVSAHAQTANAIRWDQRNAANTGYISKFIPPDATDTCMLVVSSVAAGSNPSCPKMGSGFTMSGGTLSVSSTPGPQGDPGPTGAQGESAYQIAVANGFIGTEPQWLASLVGATGATGPQGPAGMNGTGSVVSVTAGAGLSGGTITTSGTISLIPRSFGYQTRALNTCFQISASRDALVTYSVDIATSLSLTTGQQGTVYLRIYSDSGCSTGTQELTRFVNGQTGTLTIGLALTQNVTGTLTGVIPAGSYVQLVTQNNTGTPTFTARPGQEVLL